MLSKIAGETAVKRAQSIVWPRAGASPANHPAPEKRELNTSPDQLEHFQRRVIELEQEIERCVQEARQTGFREGEAAGRSQASAEIQPTLERLAKTLEELASLRPRLRREAEGDLLKFAVAIARRIVHRELTIDPESMQALIKVALEKLQTQEICKVRVHPDHESIIKICIERLRPTQKIEFIADPGQQLGTLVFETTRGNLDASIETQLREIERGLADRLKRNL